MWDYIVASYTDPMFLKFPIYTTLYGLFLYLLFALPLSALAYYDPPAFRKWRVTDEPINVMEFFWASLGKLFSHNLLLLAIMCLAWPVVRLFGVHDGPMPPWYIVVGLIVLFLYVDDFLTYWVHKAMHRGWLYRNVHSVHHKVRNPSAMDNSYFHWFEFLALMSTGMVLPLLMGAHVDVIRIWLTIRIWQSVVGHCGYTFPWDPVRIFPMYEGGDYHYFHHLDARGNFSGILPYLDRIWGRVAPNYRRYKVRTHDAGGRSGLFKLRWKPDPTRQP